MNQRVNRHGVPLLDAGHKPKRHLDPFDFDANEAEALVTLRQWGNYRKQWQARLNQQERPAQ